MDAHSPPPWDFSPVYTLLDAFRLDAPAAVSDAREEHGPAHHRVVSDRSHVSPESNDAASLGDFNNVFEYLGAPVTERLARHGSAGSSSTACSHRSTDPSSHPDEALQPDEPVDRTKEVRWTDEVDGSDLAERYEPVPQRKHARRRRHSTTSLPRPPTALAPSPAKYTPLPVATKKEDSDPVSILQPPRSLTSSRITFPILNVDVDPLALQPIYCLTPDEKKDKLLRKLEAKFHDVPTTKLGAKDPNGIHVFVDCSNIVIGFNTTLKIQRHYSRHAYRKQAPISWSSLALILERGRPAARRILVGSNAPSPTGQPAKLPEYMVEAEACGYELNILDRVLKGKDVGVVRKKRRGAGNGYATASGYSSGSDTGSRRIAAVVEQGVDEILHMKLLESLVDSNKPSTIVLASGDAAEAEFSGGFLKNVERAMAKGWKVELVSWKNCISSEYMSRRFLRKWRGKFEVIMLDDFSEELLALYAYPIVL